jgi:transposase-like protein
LIIPFSWFRPGFGGQFKEMVHTMKSEQDAREGRAGDITTERSKQELVRQSLEPGASVSAIALRSGVNANMLFKWRREHLRGTVAARCQLYCCR